MQFKIITINGTIIYPDLMEIKVLCLFLKLLAVVIY